MKTKLNVKRSTMYLGSLGGILILGAASLVGYEFSRPASSSHGSKVSASELSTISSNNSKSVRSRHRHPYQVTQTYYLKKKGVSIVVTETFGRVVAANSNSLTLGLPTGKDVSFTITSSTKFKGLTLGILEDDLSHGDKVRGAVVTVGSQVKIVRSHAVASGLTA